MRKIASCFMAVFILGLITGCAQPLVVNYDYDTTYDFTKLKTYEWLPSPPGDQMEDLVEKRVQGAVDSQLRAKGYNRSAESPDFMVSVEGIKKTVDSGSVAVGGSIGVPVGRGSMSVGMGKSKPRVKQEGTLNLNFVDARTQTLVWKGMAQAEIKEKTSPEEQQQSINQVVAEILKKFPPGAMKK